LHLRRFKATQIFREVTVSIAQRLAEHHASAAAFAGSGCGVRANHKGCFTHKHDAAKNHSAALQGRESLCEWLFSRFSVVRGTVAERKARATAHLVLPVFRGKPFPAERTFAVCDQRGR